MEGVVFGVPHVMEVEFLQIRVILFSLAATSSFITQLSVMVVESMQYPIAM